MAAPLKYTDEQLASIIGQCTHSADVLRKLGVKPRGYNFSKLRKRISRLGLSTSHFCAPRTGNKGNLRISTQELLVYGRKEGRENSAMLRRAMKSLGVEEKCHCGVGTIWNGEPIQLDVDHISGDLRDSRIENLRFICQNCHGQKTRRDLANLLRKH